MKNRIFLFLIAVLSVISVSAKGRPVIFVNPAVTTHIVMPEQLKMVDLSTNAIVGDQCTDNMVRIKPLWGDSIADLNPMILQDRGFLGAITLIGERYMAQYDIIYSADPEYCEALYKIPYEQCILYSNPDVSMPEAEMANYAWAIMGTKRKYNSVRTSAYGISAQVYNIYAIGNYFFVDLYLKNNTNIPYNIEQMRVSLTDKKETKATNSQTLELTPVYVLNDDASFRKDYRQVIVLERLTFPEEKVLNIEFTENQISGRVVTIPIEYEDILHADGFDKTKMSAYQNVTAENKMLLKEIRRLRMEVGSRDSKLAKAYKDITDLETKLKKTRHKYMVIEKKVQAMQQLNLKLKKLNESMADVDFDDIDISDDSEALPVVEPKSTEIATPAYTLIPEL